MNTNKAKHNVFYACIISKRDSLEIECIIDVLTQILNRTPNIDDLKKSRLVDTFNSECIQTLKYESLTLGYVYTDINIDEHTVEIRVNFKWYEHIEYVRAFDETTDFSNIQEKIFKFTE